MIASERSTIVLHDRFGLVPWTAPRLAIAGPVPLAAPAVLSGLPELSPPGWRLGPPCRFTIRYV